MAPTAKKKEQPAKDKKGNGKGKAPIGRFDPYVNSKSVTGLERFTFEEFLKDKDAVLVFFYDPTEPDCDWSKKHLIRAAKTTIRDNHAYAAMDCVKESDFCKEENIEAPFPVYKLYSRGTLIDTYSDHRSFLFPLMRKYMENVQVVYPYETPKRPCDKDE